MDDHTHKFFCFQVKADFEPVLTEATVKTGNKPLYDRVEYAYLSCNCGESKRVKVKNEPVLQ